MVSQAANWQMVADPGGKSLQQIGQLLLCHQTLQQLQTLAGGDRVEAADTGKNTLCIMVKTTYQLQPFHNLASTNFH